MELDAIEARWRAASAGPWTIETAAQSHVSEPVGPDRRVRAFQDAVRLGFCQTMEEYVQLLEDIVSEPFVESSLLGTLDAVTACPEMQLRALQRRDAEEAQDWLASGRAHERASRIFEGADPTDPSLPNRTVPPLPPVTLWVGTKARPQDVEFVRHAAKDVGDLISEVERLRQMVRDRGGDPS